ncbi:hypothetical protein [Niallia sp. 01092]|uniref:hypothetical protein n=1 Tax=unclassified Niallia TaxID=2837522 RepID=UPI003FD391D6
MLDIGVVSSVSTTNKTAKVIWSNRENVVSGDLFILDRGDDWMPKVKDPVVCLCFDKTGFILGKY